VPKDQPTVFPSGTVLSKDSECILTALPCKIRLRLHDNALENDQRAYGFEILAEPIGWCWPEQTAGLRVVARTPTCFTDEGQAAKDAVATWNSICSGVPKEEDPGPSPN